MLIEGESQAGLLRSLLHRNLLHRTRRPPAVHGIPDCLGLGTPRL
jgi:hypothetical protein